MVEDVTELERPPQDRSAMTSVFQTRLLPSLELTSFEWNEN
jgi:hypothetical protein